MYKVLIASSLALCVGTSTAQDTSEYERWRAATQQDFKNYLDENDKAFISFLKQRWEEIDTESGKTEDTAPKPDDIPVAPPMPAPLTQTLPEDVDKPATATTPDVVIAQPQPIAVPKTPPIIPVAGPATDLTFYGYRLSIPYRQAMSTSFRQQPSPDSIAEGWERLAKSDYKQTLEQLTQWQASLNLSDWATAQLIVNFSANVAPDDSARTLLSWFLMVKLGYDARLAYNHDLYLLMPTDDDVFDVTFFTMANKRYYALPIDGPVSLSSKVFTYGKQHESASEELKFRTAEKFIAGGQQEERTLTYREGEQTISVVLTYPEQQVRYLNTVPQLALPRYPIAELPQITREQITQQLRPLLDGQPEEVAVNRLLNFVQNAFKYETDEQQFRKENYLFPLETLHYAASDCEDRAALFSQLVHDLLGLPVVLLDYPGHVAAAVAFSGNVEGDTFIHAGRRFTVTDPTYINARVGMVMPQFAQIKPAVVDIF